MARLIVVAMRLLVWCLLSADLEAANLAIGLAVALALPQPRANRSLPLAQLLQAVLASLRAVPQAYGEAFQLVVLRRPAGERLEHSPVEWSRQGRSQGQPPAALVFLDVFRITLTPLTIALGLDAAGRQLPGAPAGGKAMSLLLFGMVLALLLPILVVCRRTDVWHRLAAFASVSTKVAMLMLVVSVVRDDWMVGLVGVIVLCVGNGAVMLLANLLRGVDP